MSEAVPQPEERKRLPRLLRSKLNPPIAGPSTIRRTRLDEWVYASLRAKLALVQAPAGFGKTTVMLQLLSRLKEQGRAAAWLTLDDADNDEGRFLAYLLSALQKIDPQLDPIAQGTFPIEGETLVGTRILDVLHWVTNSSTPFALFLDDFEVIKNPEVLLIVRKILDCLLPEQLLVVGTREVPDLGIGRLRVRGHLLEIGSGQLRFAWDELDQFLRRERGLKLADEDLLRLHRCTEGWVAALHLVALALVGREDHRTLIESFSGSFSDLADYLAEDVLSRQTEDVRGFLLKTSILERLCGPLCDAVTGRSESYSVLSALEKANLFLTPLDEERRWCRYHNLFAGFLRGRLERDLPEAVPGLHRLASEWFAQRGLPVEAANHAFAAGDLDRAAGLVAECATSLVWLGQLQTVADWVARLPSKTLDRHPQLRIALCWALAMRFRADEARSVLDQIRAGLEEAGEHRSEIEDEINSVGPVVLSLTDRVDQCLQLAESNFPKMHDRNSFACGVLANYFGCHLMDAGRFDESHRMLGRARAIHAQLGSVMGSTYSDCLEGLLDMLEGRVRSALTRFRTALERVNRGVPGRSVSGAVSSVCLASALYERNELVEAERLLTQVRDLFPECVPLDMMLLGYLTLARTYAARDNFDAADELLREAEAIGRERGTPRAAATVQLERIRFDLFRGDVDAAVRRAGGREDSEVWKRYEDWILPANDPETPRASQLRLMIRQGQARQALPQLKAEIEKSEGLRLARRALKLRVLTVEAFTAIGETKNALRILRSTLLSAAPEGYVRAFVDEGQRIIDLVREIRAGSGTGDAASELSEGYLDRILGSAGRSLGAAPPGAVAAGGAHEELTARELEILGMMARGFSNSALADGLFVSITTIKFHLRNINSKLGVESRMAAVAKARQLGLIP
ncbi:MAG: hypothetical protein HY900_22960 [Deltaproteobacteria bacterium]|nr:hypothetical protein [Deltaproteobacteria bacterium]